MDTVYYKIDLYGIRNFSYNIYLIKEECFEQQKGWHITLVQYAHFIFPMGF